MASAARTEPHVLAETKRTLFPDLREDGYAVADTQFAREHWIDDHPIDGDVTATLAPFNHVRIGSGYPDLVAVGHLDDAFLAVDRLGEEPPLIAVEAKGEDWSGGVDVERGVVQAHDRLDEANVAFASAPADSISQSARTLARELNVGVLGVEPDGSLTVLEQPRVVGNRTTDAANAIRFQASAQGVAEKSFGLNHPKNYLAVPLAVAHDHDARSLIAEHVVGAVSDAFRGARFLGLVETHGPSHRLTPLGEEMVRFAHRTYPSLRSAIEDFETFKRSRTRFIDEEPRWGEVTRRVVYDYPATNLLVEELQTMHDDGVASPTLLELVEWLHEQHPTFTVELFVRGDEDVRRRVLTTEGDLRTETLTDGSIYHAPTVFQLKAMLYHAGIVADRGAEPSRLDPEVDEWRLRNPLSRHR
ncbi:MAG: hypothetical protein ACOCR6_01530 [archaeon]